MGDEITNSIAADGQTNPSANLPMNGFKHTGVANATARNQYATAADVQDQDLTYFVDSGAADAYVITPSPSIGAYEGGQRLVFLATNTNTGASTLNVNGLGAFAIQTPDGQALGAGAITSGGIYEVTYDANSSPDRWIMTSPPSEIPDSMLSSNVPLLDVANVFTGANLTVSTSSSASIRLEDTAASLNEAPYRVRIDGGQFDILLEQDDYAANNRAFSIFRTGIAIDEIELNATTLDFNGNVDVSGSLVLGTALAVAEGGTGGVTQGQAQTNLGLAIGTNVQAQDAGLDDISGLAVTNGNFIVGDGSNWVAESGATARTSLGAAASSVNLTAGNGLTGGGTLAADRSFAVGAGEGLAVAADSIGLDISSLTNLSGSQIEGDDDLLIYDASAATHRAIQYQNSGLPVYTGSIAKTFVDGDANAIHELTGSTDRVFTLNIGVGIQGNFIFLVQSGTGSIQVSGTATINGAAGLFTRTQYSVALLLCIANNTWIMAGDTAVS